MERIQFLINTYRRPELLIGLLKQINSYSEEYAIDLLIYEDASDADYSACVKFLSRCKKLNFNWLRTEEHCGKTNYWKIINTAYQRLRIAQFDYLIHLPDDVQLVPCFVPEAIRQFNCITDSKKACLNLLNDFSRKSPMWTNVEPKPGNYNGTTILRTGWVDLCYIATRKYLTALNHCVFPIPEEWAANPERSSGVGMQISTRIHRAGLSMYQVNKSMVIHGVHNSVMHPQHRKEVPLITNTMKITATMASMPSRIRSLQQTINSLINQVDEIQVYLNDYEMVPEFLKHDKIIVYCSQSEVGDIGDAGKFYAVDSIKGFHFTVDDDLIYPTDYIAKMVAQIEKYGRNFAITIHGRIIGKTPIGSYYHNFEKAVSCLNDQRTDTFVNIGGTGVMAYCTDNLKLSICQFKAANMADIWFAIQAAKQNVPILSIAHFAGWVREGKYDRNDTIYANCNGADEYQTRTVNAFAWPALAVL